MASYSYGLFGTQDSYTNNAIQYTYYTYRPDGLRHSIGSKVHLWDGANIVADINGSDMTVYFRGINLIYAENDGDFTYYHFNLGRVIGDCLSAVTSVKELIVGIETVVAAVTISVEGVALGAAVVVDGAGDLTDSVSNFSSDFDDLVVAYSSRSKNDIRPSPNAQGDILCLKEIRILVRS